MNEGDFLPADPIDAECWHTLTPGTYLEGQPAPVRQPDNEWLAQMEACAGQDISLETFWALFVMGTQYEGAVMPDWSKE